jgi:hypothetical protein
MTVAPPAPPVVAGELLPQPGARTSCDRSTTVPKYVTVRIVIESSLGFLFFCCWRA